MDVVSVFEPSIKKLEDLVRSRYGCDLTFESTERLTSEEVNSLHSGSSLQSGDNLYFPVFLKMDLVGVIRLSLANINLAKRELDSIQQIVQLMISARSERVEKIDELIDREENLRSVKSNESALPANVIRVHQFQSNAFPLPENQGETQLAFPFLIESRAADDVFKMALEVHQRSGRMAFLPLKDLDQTMLESADSLHSMGSVSIFIADIAEVPFAQQNSLLNYLKSPRQKDSPQIIAGMRSNLNEVKKSSKVNADLLQHLLVGYLVLTQPFEYYKHHDVLNFFYDSLTGRSTI